MNLDQVKVLTDRLGQLRSAKDAIETEAKETSKEIEKYLGEHGMEEVSAVQYRALIVPTHSVVWKPETIERLAKKHGVRLSRLRDLNYYNQVRTYRTKELPK